MSEEPDRVEVVVRGAMRTIEYAVCANGSSPARGFIESLDERDQRRLDVLFRRMADTGKIFNREQFKQVKGKIYEFKRYQVRVGCFQVQSSWILTHGFVKKSPRWPKSEIERAERIMSEELARRVKQRNARG